MKQIVLIFFALLFFTTLNAEVLTLSCDKKEEKGFYNYLQYYKDVNASISTKNSLEISQVDFTHLDRPNANLGLSFQNRALWLKFSLKNSCPNTQQRVLFLKKITNKSIELYEENGERFVEIKKTPSVNNAYYDLSIDPNETKRYYLRLIGDGPYIIASELIDSRKAIEESYISGAFFFFFTTFVSIAIIVYLLIFIFLREVIYLYFSLHISSHLMLWLSVYGVFTAVELSLVKVISIFISSTFITLLSFEILQTRKYMPGLSKVLLAFLFFMNFYFFVGFYLDWIEFYAPIFGITSFITYMLIIASILGSIKRGSKKVIYLLLAVIGYILGYYITVVGVFTLGKIPVNDFTLYAGMMGAIIDIVFVSLAFIHMAEKTYHDQRKKLLEYSRSLEGTVQERTLKIQEQNSLLHLQAITDTLTQLPNRLELDRYCTSAFADRGHSEKELFALLIDIDNFKQVNDVYGHLFGDAVLKTISKVLLKSLKESDMVGRWGGDEFLVVVHVSKADDIAMIAERVRKNVRNKELEHNVRITISLGVSSARDKKSIGSWIQSADEALYRAKKRGKDRVVFS